jgi:hypothetical protein
MRGVCRILLAALFLSPLCGMAQQPAAATAQGLISMINATGEDGNLVFAINNELVSRRGLPSGRAAGPIGYRTAGYSIKMKHDFLGDLDTNVTLGDGDHLLLVVTPKPVSEDTPPATRKEKMECQVVNLRRDPNVQEHTIALLQITNVKQLPVTFGSGAHTLDYAKPQFVRFTEEMGKFPRLMFRQSRITSINMDEPRDMAIVLYTDKQGVLKAVQISNGDRKQETAP